MRADGAGRRELELELDLPRMILLAVVALLALGGAFVAGRMSVDGETAGPAFDASPAGPADAAREREDLDGSRGLFDRADDQIQREPGRQVTEERSLGGRWEVDLGRASGREQAERLRAAVERRGVPAMVLGASGGGYRVVAGPFAEKSAAESAARRLSEGLGRDADVVEAER